MQTQLTRNSIVTPSRWAEQYRFMEGDLGGPWRFDSHPWLKEMHDSQAEENIGQKAAQMGYTETILNIAFFNLDIRKRSVLYILPNQRPDATDFTVRAINPAINLSPHIKSMFSGGADNVGIKQVGSANMYIRGSNSRGPLKSIPVGVIMFDEFEEHDRENTKLAEERKSGQEYRLDWKISTPMAPNTGINKLFEASTKEHFFFRCPSCSKMIQLTFPDSLVITADDPYDKKILDTHIKCNECKATLPHKGKREFMKKNEWVAEKPDSLMRGFHISQLYSTVLPPHMLAKLYLESKRDITAEQEFYNSKLGLPHLVSGAQITKDMFDSLIKGYQMESAARPGHIITLGCDVGKKLHVHVDLWDLSETNPIDINAKAKCKTIWVGELDSFEQLDQRMIDYNVTFAVVDAMPETREATAFANRFYGKVRICRYNVNATSRSMFAESDGIAVSVNRTAWLDQSLGRYRNRSIYLPSNLPKDYIDHIVAPMRIPQKDAHGNTVYRYVTQDSVPDHYAHARNYSEIALPFATGNNALISIRG